MWVWPEFDTLTVYEPLHPKKDKVEEPANKPVKVSDDYYKALQRVDSYMIAVMQGLLAGRGSPTLPKSSCYFVDTQTLMVKARELVKEAMDASAEITDDIVEQVKE